VAVIAAIVSYAHIESLALANGYSIGTARLLPFSVDGLIVASSLSLATGGRTALARTGLVLGVAATVAANVVFGVRFGVTGAVVNSRPAVSFIVSSEILVEMLRARPAAVPEAVAANVSEDVTVTMTEAVSQGVHEGVPNRVPSAVTGARPDGATGTAADTPVAGNAVQTVAVRPAVRKPRPKASQSRKPKSETVFAAELAAGNVPSLRAVMSKCHVGAPAAREILARFQELASVPEAA
jgi:hypothetical protein